MVILKQCPELRELAQLRLNCLFGDCYTIANTYQGKVAAIAVFHNPRQTHIEMSFICDHPRGMSKEFCKAVAEYVFRHWRRAICFTTPDNIKAQKLIEKIGFKREGLQRKASGDGRDLIMYGILKDECKYV